MYLRRASSRPAKHVLHACENGVLGWVVGAVLARDLQNSGRHLQRGDQCVRLTWGFMRVLLCVYVCWCGFAMCSFVRPSKPVPVSDHAPDYPSDHTVPRLLIATASNVLDTPVRSTGSEQACTCPGWMTCPGCPTCPGPPPGILAAFAFEDSF